MTDIKDLKGMVGRKFDSEKPKMYLLPPKATVEVAKVLTFGAAKYDEENWRKLEDAQNRYSGGALRHIFSHLDGELTRSRNKFITSSARYLLLDV